MPATVANINKYAAAGRIYAFADTPADGALMTHTSGVPAGYHTREVGATIGAATLEYRPTISLTDVEQFFGQVAPRLTADSVSLKCTLAEASWRNLELALQQSQVANILAGDFNSSFEYDANSDGTADNWNQVGTSTRTIQTDNATASGTKCQQFVAGVGVPGGIISDAVEHPRLAPAAVALFSTYLKAASGTPTVRLKIEAFNASNVSQGSNTFSGAITTGWVRYSVAFTLPANTAYVKLTVDDATGQNIAVKVDQAQLELVAATSVTPSPYVPHRGLFIGGRTGVDTYTVVLMSLQTTGAFYNWVCLYSAFASEGGAVSFKRGEPRQVPVTFYGLPIPTRTASDQTFQIVEEK